MDTNGIPTLIDNTTQPQPQPTFNIFPTAQFGEKIAPGELGEGILNHMQERASLLKTSSLVTGDFFQGLVYCTRTVCASNVNEPNKYDITLTLIDGDGIQFTGKKWACEEKVEHIDTVLYIEGTTIAYSDNVVRYRIDTFKRYNAEVSKSLFIREITNLPEAYTAFRSSIERVTTPQLKLLLTNLVDKYGYGEILKTTTYKPAVGTKLGSKISMINTIIQSIDNIKNNLDPDMNQDIYISLAILYMIDLATKQASPDPMAVNSLQVCSQIMNEMYNTGCFTATGADQTTIQRVFNGLITTDRTKEIYTNPPECIAFNNSLQSIERCMRSAQSQRGSRK